MVKRAEFICFIILMMVTILFPRTSSAISMADYTAYPPFITNAVAPNILLVLDHSGSMQFPAYIGCDFAGYSGRSARCGTSDTSSDPDYNYNSTREYYGYFRTEKYYEYGSNKFYENDACSYSAGDAEYRIGSGTACISGNLLNWASMSRIDVLRKVLIGGKSVSQQGNAHTLRGEGGRRTFTDENLECTFDITGGSYPNFDHNITISDASGGGGLTGTCGYLTVWANGSSMWGKRDRFRYIYQSASGDFDAKLKIVSAPTTSPYAKAGLVVRRGTNSRHQHVKAMATNGYGLQFSYRSSYGGNTYQVGNYVPASYPVWVRITKNGDLYTFYYSSDGTNWTTHGSQNVNLLSSPLIGMGVSSYSRNTLGKAEFDELICTGCSGDDFNNESFNTSIWSAMDIYTTKPGNQTEQCGSAGGCPVGPVTAANLRVDVPSSTKSGVIHALSDTDGDGDWDEGSPRFGLMIYNSDNIGCMKTGIAGSNMSSFVTALQNEPPYNGTPTGEALNEAWDYFVQSDANSGCNNNAYVQSPGGSKDPWYDNDPVPCRDSFVLLISDGEWNGSVDPVRPARGSHVSDIRPDMDGTQVLSHFSVYSFGYEAAGENSMQQIAMYGGFDDYDGSTWPYNRTAYPSDSRNITLPASPCDPDSPPMADECEEWDSNDDGLPDTYYQASEGDSLEASLIQAISDILKRSSSGTAVSVLSTTGEGEGAIYQAYFLPQKLEGIEPRKWLGYIQALFVDKYGNLREDTNGNNTLDLTADYIIQMSYDNELGSVVDKYTDADGDGDKDTPSSPAVTVGLDDINALWKGGSRLWETDPADRTIFTTTNGYSSIDFTTSNGTQLQPYLRAFDLAEANNIISWVRGDDITGTIDAGHDEGYRKRDLTIDERNREWKLGDIIHSTPTVVGKAVENYDLLYGDITYANYRARHLKRRLTVYTGANDGMLHAFNAGCFNSAEHRFYSDVNTGSGVCYDNAGEPLGQELWAFIPHNVTPHLKWNTMPGYTHVYDVDLKPKVSDVKIFEPDDKHVSGWGTILIGGLRYGGKDIKWCSLDPDVLCAQNSDCNSVGAGTCTGGSGVPEYFALDITDPDDPRVLWSFSDPDLGLTMSNPAIAKIGGNWYAIFGSGAAGFDTGADLTAFQAGTFFVLDLSSGTDGIISSWTLNDNYWKISTGNSTSFLADPINVDVDLDFNTDVIYIGENYQQGGNWNALMQRITTNRGANTPSLWELSTLADVDSISNNNDNAMKITSAPSAAIDNRANLFVYFGTGQYYGSADNNQTDTGGFYAIKDSCWDGDCSGSVSSILDVSQSSVETDGDVNVSGSCGGAVSTWPDLLTASYACDGWAMYFEDLSEQTDFTGAALSHDGERVLGKPLVIGGIVLWTTFIPSSDICSNVGESNIYAVYYQTGTGYKDYVFKEQEEQENPSSTVARVKKLGAGMPSSISAQITAGGTAKGFVQQSTGSILELESITPISLTSDVTGWKNEEID